MSFFKFCLASAFQLVLLLALTFFLAKWNLAFKKKLQKSMGVEPVKKVSLAAGIAVVLAMASILLLFYEVSTLVLYKELFTHLSILFAILFFAAQICLKTQSTLSTLLLPSENPKYFGLVLSLALALFALSAAIESNFLFSSNEKQIRGKVLTVKPARLGSPIRSVKVTILAADINHWKDGTRFFRYNTNITDATIYEEQTLPLILETGSFGLYRAHAEAPYTFLRGNMFDNR